MQHSAVQRDVIPCSSVIDEIQTLIVAKSTLAEKSAQYSAGRRGFENHSYTCINVQFIWFHVFNTVLFKGITLSLIQFDSDFQFSVHNNYMHRIIESWKLISIKLFTLRDAYVDILFTCSFLILWFSNSFLIIFLFFVISKSDNFFSVRIWRHQLAQPTIQ